MANEPAPRDPNYVPAALFEKDGVPGEVMPGKIDESTGRILVDSASGSGSVTSVSVVSANGFAGSVANPTTTPAITLSTNQTGFLLGDGTAVTGVASTGTGSVVRATSPSLTTPSLGAASATSLATSAASPLLMTNGQLVTVAITLQTVGGVTLTIPDFASVADEFVFKTKAVTMSNKTFVAPVLGAATATSINGLTVTTTTGTLTMTNAKTLSVSNTLTFAGTDATTITFQGTDTYVGRATTDTLTNKTVNLASNTLTGTTAQFNTALSDGDFATLAGAETLTNKTLTAAKIVSAGFIADANGNEQIIFTTTAAAVNELTVTNAATGNAPEIAATGGDANIDLKLTRKGTGKIVTNGPVNHGAFTAYFTETDNGNSGVADTIDWGLSNKQKSTLTGNVTYTFTAPPGPCSLIFRLVQDATGSRTATWPATVKWSGGTAPTLTTTAGRADLISFYFDGTNYYGTSTLNFTV